jgi:hypothetical protein
MNWDAIGAVEEMIGALAVVVTLAYLALQSEHRQGNQRLGQPTGAQRGQRDVRNAPMVPGSP